MQIVTAVWGAISNWWAPELSLTHEQHNQLNGAQTLYILGDLNTEQLTYIVDDTPLEITQMSSSFLKQICTPPIFSLQNLVLENAGDLSWNDLEKISMLPQLETFILKNTQVDTQIGRRGGLNKTHPNSIFPLSSSLKHLTIDGSFKKTHGYAVFEEAFSQLLTLSLESFVFSGNEIRGVVYPLVQWPKTLKNFILMNNSGGLCLFPSKREKNLNSQEIPQTLISLSIQFSLRTIPVYPQDSKIGEIVYPIGEKKIADDQVLVLAPEHQLENIYAIWELIDGRSVCFRSVLEGRQGAVLEADVLQSLPPYIVQNIRNLLLGMEGRKVCEIIVLEKKRLEDIKQEQ